MKILHVTPALAVGGAEWLLVRLAADQLAQGHDVSILSLFPAEWTPVEQWANGAGVRLRHLDKLPGLDVRIFRKIERVVRAADPHVVHTHRYALRYGALAAWRHGRHRRFVHTIHTRPDLEAPTSGDLALYRWLFRQRVEPVVVTESARAAARRAFGVSPSIVPNGVPVDLVVPDRRSSTETGLIRFVCVARLVATKGQEDVIRAMAGARSVVPRVMLALIGDGPDREALQDLTSWLGLSEAVHFLGERDDVPSLLRSQDAFILASRIEGMPISVLEAMAAGLPVIASRVGGLPDLVNDGSSGILVDLDPPESYVARLAAAMVDMALDRVGRERMGDAGRQLAKEKFSITATARAYLSLYDEPISRLGLRPF